jgi:hypothetical protein
MRMPPKSRPDAAKNAADPPLPLGDFLDANADVEALIFTTMSDAAQSARDDIRTVMASVKAINAAKRGLREQAAKVNRDVVAAAVSELEGKGVVFAANGLGSERAYRRVEIPIPDPESPGGVRVAVTPLIEGKITSRLQLEAAADVIKNRLDSLSELGEMESLRLQMAMDRLSKLMSTLSNLLKKISDTSDGIVENLK